MRKRSGSLKAAIQQIRDRETFHLRLLEAVIKADEQAIFPTDLIVAGATQRSLMLTKGFLTMLRSKNHLCAGALLRLQLDNILRVYAASLFPSGSDALMAFLEGTPLSRLKAPDGRPLTDRELCNRVGKVYDWLPPLYEWTSGFVHFSHVAVMSPVLSVSDDRRFELLVTPDGGGQRWTLKDRVEAALAFDKATRALLEVVGSWGHAKARVAAQRQRSPRPGQPGG